MSEADDRISMGRLVFLIGGADAPVAAIAQRLRRYEASGIVAPEVRIERQAQWAGQALSSFSAPSFWGGHGTGARVRPHDAYYESLRSGGSPPPVPEPVQQAVMVDARYYSPSDVRDIAPEERKIAPLTQDFCRFAWGTDVDPEVVRFTARSIPSQATTPQTFVTTSLAIERLDEMGFISGRGGSVKALFDKTSRYPELFDGARPTGSELWCWEVLVENFERHGKRGKAGMPPRLSMIPGGLKIQHT